MAPPLHCFPSQFWPKTTTIWRVLTSAFLSCLARSAYASSSRLTEVARFWSIVLPRLDCALGVPAITNNAFRICVLTHCNTPESSLTELRIARAYVRLSCFPENNPQALVSLACVGSYEIRMVRGPEIDADGIPLFWLELFDHSTQMSIDSSGCHRIKDAVPIFNDFTSQSGPEG